MRFYGCGRGHAKKPPDREQKQNPCLLRGKKDLIFGKHINRYYIRYGWMLLIGIVALIAVDFAQLKVPEFYRMVVNGMNSGMTEVDGAEVAFTMDVLLDKVCLPLIIVIVMIVGGRFLWRVGFFGAAIRVERDLRDRMFDHCKDLSQQYYQVNKVGNLMSLFTNDLETVQDCFGNGILMFLDAAFMGTLAAVKMFRMNWTLTVFSMIPMAFLFVGAMTVGRKMSTKWEERQQAFSNLSDFSQESFSGIAVIKAFAKEAKELLAFRKLNKENERVNVAFVKMSTLMHISVTLFIESVICVILGYGGYLVYKGVFNAGEMIEFIGYFTSIVWPIMAVSMLIEMHARGKASLKRISELLDAKIDVHDSDEVEEKVAARDPAMHPSIRGNIEFRNLSFAFPGTDLEVLHNVSFKINAGENVGLIGKTGTGKTTIVDLLARTYNVPDGTVFVDGMDVNTIPIRELRSHIAYVPQDNFLFSETIGSNIAFAFADADDEVSIEHAAEMAGVHDNIMEFPERYKTVLGERGVTVSGGQKQRISIARALMKNAEILILDDSVSAVDTKTEHTILENLRKERTGKTTILIAHRITTIEHMDKIIFIEDGEIVDVGSHHELCRRCPRYAEMVEMQRLEDERKERS